MSLPQLLGNLPSFGLEQTRKQVDAFHAWRNELLMSILRDGFMKQLNQEGVLPKTPGERRARERRKQEAESVKRTTIQQVIETDNASSDESIISNLTTNVDGKKTVRGRRRKASAVDSNQQSDTTRVVVPSRTPVRTRARTRLAVAASKNKLSEANANLLEVLNSTEAINHTMLTNAKSKDQVSPTQKIIQTRAQLRAGNHTTQQVLDATRTHTQDVTFAECNKNMQTTMVDKTVQTPTRASRADKRRKATAKSKQIAFDVTTQLDKTVATKATEKEKDSKNQQMNNQTFAVAKLATAAEPKRTGAARDVEVGPKKKEVAPPSRNANASVAHGKKVKNLVSESESETDVPSELFMTAYAYAYPKTPGASSQSGNDDDKVEDSSSTKTAAKAQKTKESGATESHWKVPYSVATDTHLQPANALADSARKRKSFDTHQNKLTELSTRTVQLSAQKRAKAIENECDTMELDYGEEMEIDDGSSSPGAATVAANVALTSVKPNVTSALINRAELTTFVSSEEADADSPLLFKDDPVKAHSKKTAAKTTAKHNVVAPKVTTMVNTTGISNLSDTIENVIRVAPAGANDKQPSTTLEKDKKLVPVAGDRDVEQSTRSDKPSPTFTKKRSSKSRGAALANGDSTCSKKVKTSADESPEIGTIEYGVIESYRTMNMDSSNDNSVCPQFNKLPQQSASTRVASTIKLPTDATDGAASQRSRERIPGMDEAQRRGALEDKTRAEQERLRMLKEHKEANLREKREAKRERAQLVREKRDRGQADRIAKIAQRSASATRANSSETSSNTSLNRSASVSNMNGSSSSTSGLPKFGSTTSSKLGGTSAAPRSRTGAHDSALRKPESSQPTVAPTTVPAKKEVPPPKAPTKKLDAAPTTATNSQQSVTQTVASKKPDQLKKPTVTAPIQGAVSQSTKSVLPGAVRMDAMPKSSAVTIGQVDFAAKLIQQNRELIEQEAQKAKQIATAVGASDKLMVDGSNRARADEPTKALQAQKPFPVHINRNPATVAISGAVTASSAPAQPQPQSLASAAAGTKLAQSATLATHAASTANAEIHSVKATVQTDAQAQPIAVASAKPVVAENASLTQGALVSGTQVSTATAKVMAAAAAAAAIPKAPLSMAGWNPPVKPEQPIATADRPVTQVSTKPNDALCNQPVVTSTASNECLTQFGPASNANLIVSSSTNHTVTANNPRVELETPARFVPPLLCSTIQHPSAVGPGGCAPLPSAIRPNPVPAAPLAAVNAHATMASGPLSASAVNQTYTSGVAFAMPTGVPANVQQINNAVPKVAGAVHNTTGVIASDPKANTTKQAAKFDAFQCGFKPRCKVNVNLENYGIDDLTSDDESDDELRPRKEVPAWADANGTYLRQALLKQSQAAEWARMDAWFARKRGSSSSTIDLDAVFAGYERRRGGDRFQRRTSSAMWDSPPLGSGNNSMVNDSRMSESFSDSELNSSRHNKSLRKH